MRGSVNVSISRTDPRDQSKLSHTGHISSHTFNAYKKLWLQICFTAQINQNFALCQNENLTLVKIDSAAATGLSIGLNVGCEKSMIHSRKKVKLAIIAVSAAKLIAKRSGLP